MSSVLPLAGPGVCDLQLNQEPGLLSISEGCIDMLTAINYSKVVHVRSVVTVHVCGVHKALCWDVVGPTSIKRGSQKMSSKSILLDLIARCIFSKSHDFVPALVFENCDLYIR